MKMLAPLLYLYHFLSNFFATWFVQRLLPRLRCFSSPITADATATADDSVFDTRTPVADSSPPGDEAKQPDPQQASAQAENAEWKMLAPLLYLYHFLSNFFATWFVQRVFPRLRCFWSPVTADAIATATADDSVPVTRTPVADSSPPGDEAMQPDPQQASAQAENAEWNIDATAAADTAVNPSLGGQMVKRRNRMEDLKSKIIDQVEHYFSEQNLPHDKRLKGNRDGFVLISKFASRWGIRSLTQDFIATCLRDSSLLVVSDDGMKVKRRHPSPSRADQNWRRPSASGNEGEGSAQTP